MMKDRGDENGMGGITHQSSRYYHRDLLHDNVKPLSRNITSVLLVSTVYDLFLLEEEGRLTEHFRSTYIGSGSSFIPYIGNSRSGEDALEKLKERNFDLVVIFNPPSDIEPDELASRIKKDHPGTLVGFLASDTPELRSITGKGNNFDLVLTWGGDGEVLEILVRMVEDKFTILTDEPEMNRSEILILGRDPGEMSRAIGAFWRAREDLFRFLTGVDPSTRRRKRYFGRLPRLTLCGSEADVRNAIGDRRRRISGIILIPELPEAGSIEFPDAGSIRLIRIVDDATDDDPTIISKKESNVEEELYLSLRELLFPQDLLNTRIISDLSSMERYLRGCENEMVNECLDRKSLVEWSLRSLEFELASWLVSSGEDITCSDLLSIVADVRKADDRGIVARYARGWPGDDIRVTRIGHGPMGGKGRGLAFIDRMLADPHFEVLKETEAGVPRMVIICTDMFKKFIEGNSLLSKEILSLSDERIAEKFMGADLPSNLSGDLLSIVKDFKGPISVRSSSLLEDAVFQPFAGVYASLMVPNVDNDVNRRFRDLARAVKYVYASTYFKEARDYIRATRNRPEDEKMAVIIQEVSGKQHGSLFYPNISGVARSFDFWPLTGCGRKDGTVSIALGLGKTIVDGMGGWKFSPARPDISQYNDTKDLLDSAQKRFYAIDLGKKVPRVNPEEASTLVSLDVDVAIRQGTADMSVSTIDPHSGRFYPGPYRDGPKVIDHSPVLKDRLIPLSKVARAILDIGEKGLGGPVEIEFAVNINMDQRKMKMDVLQIRSMVSGRGSTGTNIEPLYGEVCLVRSEKVLGNGVNTDIKDLILVKDMGLDMSQSRKVSEEVGRINSRMIEEDRKYILAGPGRWGSSDPWLGIPVKWSDVSGAEAIIETPVSGRIIDPSQGSHFFQNLSSLKRSYFTLTPEEAVNVPWDGIKGNGRKEEGEFLLHIKLDGNAVIRIDGETGRGTISVSDKRM